MSNVKKMSYQSQQFKWNFFLHMLTSFYFVFFFKKNDHIYHLTRCLNNSYGDEILMRHKSKEIKQEKVNIAKGD